ncbi:MAG TPA: TcpE family conjugal transfer membrane protein [Solirubrobacterales bacterium]|nr:TcpE family conjugal transfer membrane protein [Solirubrobacterales bacterium]
MAGRETKVVRSYRLVFRRRWRIFRIGNWRLPLPGGLELRLIGYWLTCLAAVSVLARLPLLGLPLAAMPPALRLLAVPLLCAWALCRWELDGRPPHRALLGLVAWRLRPRVVAAGRRVPAVGAEVSPLDTLVLTPDLDSPEYPRGRVEGPARLLLRYPVAGRRHGRKLELRRRPGPALHKGHVVEVPAGHVVFFTDGSP